MATQYGNQTWRSGFYTNKIENGENTRVYTAEDIRKPYDVIFTDGIKPDVTGTAGENLKVEVVDVHQVIVKPGFAKLGGAWFENKANFSITLDPPSERTRYDCIIIKNDDSDDVRDSEIYVKTVYSTDEITVTQAGNIYEVCVGYLQITANTQDYSEDGVLVDTRGNSTLCPIMSGVGTTVVRAIPKTYFTKNTNESEIPINVSEYNKDLDELVVMVEGVVFTEGSQYTILDNTKIKLTIPLPIAGTKVEFVVRTNVSGAAAGTVSEEVKQLQKDVATIKDTLEHHYYCGGVNDNVEIGNLVRSLADGSGYGSVKLNIHGTLVGYQPALTNTSNNTVYWFNFGTTNTSRRVVVDFTDCSQILIPTTSGQTNVVFYGKHINIVGANLIVNDTTPDTAIVVIDGSAEIVNCENCRFWITADKYSYIARHGDFTNCRGSVTNSRYYSYCFYTQKLVRLFGGEYYAYTADTSANCAVVGQTGSESVTIMYGVNAPTIERSGYYQKNAVHHIGTAGNSGVICCTDLISTLSIVEHNGYDNIRGNIKINKPNMM